MKTTGLYLFCILIICFPWFAQAETRYINENQEVPIRRGKGNEFKILAVKKTHTPVELLKDEGDYSYIRTGDGTEGWVLSRYLTAELPKPLLIEKLRAELEVLKNSQAKLNQDYQQLKEQKKLLESSSSALEQKVRELELQYQELTAASADVLQLKRSHDALKQEKEQLAQSLAALRKKNEELRSNTALMWYSAGALTLLLGIAIGMFMQSLKHKRKKSLSF